MTDKKLVGVSLVKHYEDGSTEPWQKVPAAAVSALLAAGLTVAQANQRQSRYTYLNADECPVHGPWKAIPSGTSKTTGRPYNAFWTCDTELGEERCTNKPSREWVETHPPERNDATQVAPEPTRAPTETAEQFDDLPF